MAIGALLAGLIVAATAEAAPCQPDRMLRTGVPDSPVVVLGSLAEPSEDDEARLPKVGASDHARLLVKVHLQRVVRGDFPFRGRSDFLLAVHSVAMTFGYDHVGETYYLGFEERDGPQSGLALADIRIPAEALFFVYATVMASTSTDSPEAVRVDLVAQPESVLTAVFEPGRLPPEVAANQPFLLGMPALEAPIHGQARVCLGLVHRDEHAARPLRLVRLVRSLPRASEQ